MPSARSDLHISPSVAAAAVLTGAAGLVHMAAAVTHMGEARWLGLAFALTGWMQMVTAIWVAAGRGRAALMAMSFTNAAALAGWGLSRTVGLPVVHPAVEAAGVADMLTAGMEVAAVAAAAVGVMQGRPEVAGDAAWRRLAATIAVTGIASLGATGAAAATLGTSEGHGHADDVATGANDPHGRAEADGEPPSSESSAGLTSDPGTLPAKLHRHRPGVYHLHDGIELHEHAQGLVHVHTSADPDGEAGSEDAPEPAGHDDGDGHAH